jgi:hypothetical protein
MLQIHRVYEIFRRGGMGNLHLNLPQHARRFAPGDHHVRDAVVFPASST